MSMFGFLTGYTIGSMASSVSGNQPGKPYKAKPLPAWVVCVSLIGFILLVIAFAYYLNLRANDPTAS